ncbi:MAG TPA: AI-2E family transporter [Vulgatibacter sp.]|nr:AI-2E family transporter [Vulgatibacter sp.]
MEGRPPIRWSTWAFIFVFATTLVFFVVVVWPFLIPVLIGAFVVVLFDAPHEALVRKLHGRRGLAALLSTVAVFLLILVPTAAVVFILVEQAVELVGNLAEYLGPGGFSALLGGQIPEPLRPLVDRLEGLGIGAELQTALSSLGKYLAGLVGGILSTATAVFINGFLVVVSIYYFFLDGRRLLRELSRATPMDVRYEAEFFREFRDVAQTMIFVNVVTALVQGVLGGIGFVVVKLPSPLVWAVLMAFLSLVPILGTGLVWAPAAVILLLSGRIVAGLFLLAWGFLVVGTVDNLLRPFLAKGRIRLHPLLVFVTIFGGLAVFGFVGVVIGPLIGSLFTAMVRIWKRDFAPRFAGPRTLPRV